MKNFDQYYQAVAYLESLPKLFGRVDDPSINMKRMRYFLDLLGNPDKGMKIIHITGTAGKGSVAHLIYTSIVKSGKKAGLFSSPHSTVLIEEIQTDGLYIDPSRLSSIVESIKGQIEKVKESVYGSLSIFEVIFAIALLYFKQESVEWVVLEVGLGGKYDATNVISTSKISVITNIGLDHTEILGKRLKDIAIDKAGIIKKGNIFFTTEKRPVLQKYFQSVCKNVGAVCNVLKTKNISFGESNRLLAQNIVESIHINKIFFEQAVAEFNLPGRFEILSTDDRTVILDGAHNPIKMKSVAENLQKFSNKKINLVVAIAKGKDANGILKHILPKVDKVYITAFDTQGRSSVSLEDMEKICHMIAKKIPVNLIEDPISAFKKAEKEALEGDIILVTGSFFLVEIIRKIFYPENFILSNRRSK
jgi:dihydrofolate synthase/folylpolyglutamate synthase